MLRCPRCWRWRWHDRNLGESARSGLGRTHRRFTVHNLFCFGLLTVVFLLLPRCTRTGVAVRLVTRRILRDLKNQSEHHTWQVEKFQFRYFESRKTCDLTIDLFISRCICCGTQRFDPPTPHFAGSSNIVVPGMERKDLVFHDRKTITFRSGVLDQNLRSINTGTF